MSPRRNNDQGRYVRQIWALVVLDWAHSQFVQRAEPIFFGDESLAQQHHSAREPRQLGAEGMLELQ